MNLVDATIDKEEVAKKVEEYEEVDKPTAYDLRVREAFREMEAAITAADSGARVVDLHATMHRAFVREDSFGRGDWLYYPELAVMFAKAMGKQVDFVAHRNRSCEFGLRWGPFTSRVRFPKGTSRYRERSYNWTRMPVVPPRFRPKGGFTNELLLWEPIWKRDEPDPDPVLLKPLGNGLCMVLAEWDLTQVEAASMNYL